MGVGRLSGCCFPKQCTCFKHSRAEADDAKRLKLPASLYIGFCIDVGDNSFNCNACRSGVTSLLNPHPIDERCLVMSCASTRGSRKRSKKVSRASRRWVLGLAASSRKTFQTNFKSMDVAGTSATVGVLAAGLLVFITPLCVSNMTVLRKCTVRIVRIACVPSFLKEVVQPLVEAQQLLA